MFLYFLNPECIHTKKLLVHSVLMEYINVVEGQGIGSSGVLQKLDAHALALKFFQLSVEDDDTHKKVEQMLSFLVDVRKSFKKKRKKQRDRLEAASLKTKADSLDAVNKFLCDPLVTEKFFEAAATLLRGFGTNIKSLYNLCMGLLTARLMYSFKIIISPPLM